MNVAPPPPLTPRRSSFVAAVGWIFAVGGGFATAISAVQNIMFHTMIARQMPDPDELASLGMPPIFGFLFSHLDVILGAFFVTSLVTVAAAIGLLRRKNWARLAFIVLLALGILWNLAGIGLQQSVVGMMGDHLANAPADFQEEFQTALVVIRTVTAIFALGLSALFGWMIKRFLDDDVRTEFVE